MVVKIICVDFIFHWFQNIFSFRIRIFKNFKQKNAVKISRILNPWHFHWCIKLFRAPFYAISENGAKIFSEIQCYLYSLIRCRLKNTDKNLFHKQSVLFYGPFRSHKCLSGSRRMTDESEFKFGTICQNNWLQSIDRETQSV